MCFGDREAISSIFPPIAPRETNVSAGQETLRFIRTAAINYDVERFMLKWLRDVMLEQREDGAVGSVVPGVSNRGEYISAGWGDAATICPWELYLAYGRKEILREFYPMMCKWVEYIRNEGDEEYLWLGGKHYGDWLASDAILSPEMREGATQKDLIASAFFCVFRVSCNKGRQHSRGKYRPIQCFI